MDFDLVFLLSKCQPKQEECECRLLQYMASATSSYSLRCKSSGNRAAFPFIWPNQEVSRIVVVISLDSLTGVSANKRRKLVKSPVYGSWLAELIRRLNAICSLPST